MDMANSLISLISRIHVRKDEGRNRSIVAYARLSNAAIAEHHQAGREVGHCLIGHNLVFLLLHEQTASESMSHLRYPLLVI